MKSNIFAHYFLKPNKGFTLIEIAIILTALGIFVSIAAIAVQSLTHSGMIAQNRKILAKYNLSVRGFLASNYRVVCPDMDDDGVEDFVGSESGMTNCADYTGYLPYQTLGLPSGEDAWGNMVKFSMYEPEETGGLIINEIHYNSTFAWQEFIELYNNSGSAIDLSGYEFTSGIVLTFPGGATIAAEEYILCVKDENDPLWDGAGYQIFEYNSNLSNQGQTIELEDGAGNVVDSVSYDDAAPWPEGHDEGTYSIELIDFEQDNDNGTNWSASSVSGGTPGQENSVFDSQGGNPLSDAELCEFLNTQPDDYDLTNKIYVDNATGAFYHPAYIIVSGGPKDLDDQGGLFDGYNGISPEVRFESPDKISDSDYDDFVAAVSFNELYNEICTSSGEVN